MLYIICNSSDLASECVNPHDTRYLPERILLYDSHPGGTNISAQVNLTAALELLTLCWCSVEAGCPNCVQGVLELEKSKFRDTSSSSLN
ncbi:nucleic acid binding,ATP-dependent helicase [Artemisia annua]|uniref:Nucleic acid binding,ATP-dependent helicase n=1 Tax=Artemisia annua TaxID=35608 RepID=A0A2U1NEZ2_ARTAN|nr:nucleic acid binding,ATP-dependent helicase [Artemisia annua]